MKLRTYNVEHDYQYIEKWITDERMHALWCAKRIPYPMTKEIFHAFLESDAAQWGSKSYVVTEDDCDIPIGFFSINVNSADRSSFCKCIVVDSSVRGKGYGTRMMECLKNYAFETLGVSLVQLNVFDANPGAKKCYEKAGFVAESFTPNSITCGEESWGHYRMVCSIRNNNAMCFETEKNCSTAEAFNREDKRTFILGTDWGTDCDDVVAVRLLTRASKAGKINLAAIGINHCLDLNSVASLDGFLTRDGLTGVAIGLDRDITEGKGRYQEHLAQFASSYRSNEDAEDAVRLYRRILAEAKNKVEICEIGFLQVIAKVLESGPDDISDKNGLDLVREKVAKLWVMAGKWDQDAGLEYNIMFNPITRRATRILCEKCPVPITFLGWEIGHDVITGSTLRKDDILYKALCDHGSSAGRYSWDPMLVMLALVGDENEAGYSIVQGTARVDEETGCNYFERKEEGLHRYVMRQHEPQYYAKQIDDRIN